MGQALVDQRRITPVILCVWRFGMRVVAVRPDGRGKATNFRAMRGLSAGDTEVSGFR